MNTIVLVVLSTSTRRNEATMESPKTSTTDDVDNLEETVKELASNLQGMLLEALEGKGQPIDEKTNFTWEHFFTEKCGILEEDARKYERSLIASRMSPVDTLLESLSLIVEYGRIPIGDKLKIGKTLKRAQEDMAAQAKAMEEARKKLGLEKYNDFQASSILNLGGGDTEYHIEYGIEQFEEGMEDWQHTMSVQMLKDPETAEAYSLGAAVGRKLNDPVYKLLGYFGYKTFEYTHGKNVEEPSVAKRPTSSDPKLDSVLLGTLVPDEDEIPAESARLMYS